MQSTAGRAASNVAAVWLGAFVIALCSGSASADELAVLRNGFSIRHEHRLVMGDTTRLYLGADDSSFTDVPTADITGYEKDLTAPASPVAPLAPVTGTADSRTAAATAIVKPAPLKPSQLSSARLRPAPSRSDLNNMVNSASAAYHLDPDLVNSVIHAESGFNAHAISPKGARGLMQLMPGTAGQLGVNDAFDPLDNVTGGSRYLRELLERYNFDIVKALAAYNAGPDRVEQYQGVPPFRETRAYVAKIVHEYNTKKIAQEKEARRKQLAAKAASKASGHAAHATKTNGTVVASKSSQSGDSAH